MSGVSLPSAANAGGLSSIASPANDPTAAITKGDALFNSAYAATGSFTQLVGFASAVAADLPSGAFAETLSKALALGGDAMAGAALGSTIFPGVGTAVGAVMGAVMGFIQSIGTSAPVVEGDMRTTAEQYVFPAVLLPPPAGTPTLAFPSCFSDVRANVIAYEENQATFLHEPGSYNFGVGWVSPAQAILANPAFAGDTDAVTQSESQAWSVAQAWMSQNVISGHFALRGPNAAIFNSQAGELLDTAETELGQSDASLLDQAIRLVNSWYGKAFSKEFSSQMSLTDFQSQLQGSGKVLADFAWYKYFMAYVAALNKSSALDYTYYVSNTLCSTRPPGLVGNNPDQVMPGYAAAATSLAARHGTIGGTDVRTIALPDTVLVGIAQIACLVVSGVLTEAEANYIVLHYVMGLAWLWRRGQLTDQRSHGVGAGEAGFGNEYVPLENHPNFSRILGIVQAKIQGTAKAASAKVTAQASAKTAAAAVAASKAKAAAASKAAKANTAPALSPLQELLGKETTLQILESREAVMTPTSSAPEAPAPARSASALTTVGLLAAGGAIWWLYRSRHAS